MLAYDRAGLEKIARRLVRPDAPALLQQVATGVRETHKFLRQDGRTIARLVMVAERCWPPLGGSSVMRVTVEPPVRLAPARRGARRRRRPRGRVRGRVPARRRRPSAADGDQRAHLAVDRPGPPRGRRAGTAAAALGARRAPRARGRLPPRRAPGLARRRGPPARLRPHRPPRPAPAPARRAARHRARLRLPARRPRRPRSPRPRPDRRGDGVHAALRDRLGRAARAEHAARRTSVGGQTPTASPTRGARGPCRSPCR